MSKQYRLQKFSALAAANFALGMTFYSDLAVADYSLPYASPTAVYGDGYCYVVTNYNGSTAFIPTNNGGEFSSVINVHDGSLVFSSCGIGQGDAGCGYCGDGGWAGYGGGG